MYTKVQMRVASLLRYINIPKQHHSAVGWDEPTQRQASLCYTVLIQGCAGSGLYNHLSISTDFAGRFELIALAIWLFVDGMPTESPQPRWVKYLGTTLLHDCDSAFREKGIGDTKVPSLVRDAYGALMGRINAYRHGAIESDMALADAIGRNCLGQKYGSLEPDAKSYLVRFAGHLRVAVHRDKEKSQPLIWAKEIAHLMR